jgi:hypothetical protein
MAPKRNHNTHENKRNKNPEKNSHASRSKKNQHQPGIENASPDDLLDELTSKWSI